MPGHADIPLAGLRVVDLSTQIAGPYCTKLLVDAGADVVKVEPPAGDPFRRWTASGADLADGESGALFQFLNAGKRSIALDLDARDGRATLLDLATRADVIVESSLPAEATRLELDLESLGRDNSALCLVSITPWGREGPWAQRPCTEFTLQAATGSTGYRGLPGRGPIAAGGRIGEWIAGSYAAVGALAAWLSARNTGEGQHVDLSMFEAMVQALTVFHDLDGQWKQGPLPQGVEIPSIEPAKDGWVGICTITGQQWVDFCTLIGRPDIGEDPRFLDASQRMKHIGLMQEVIHAWTRERGVDEIIELASLLRLPVAPVGDGRTTPRMDHMIERGIFSEGPGGFLRPRVPYRLGDATPPPFAPAPRIDEHAREIRAELATPRPALRAPLGGAALPLDGLRVVDLTAFWAGPIASSTLAALGADVVKVESIQRPDGMRFAGSVPGERLWEWSPVFAGANPGKRDVTLDLDSERGMALMRQLIEGADVLIENYSARVVENFGLGWEALHAINPRLVMVRMPAFGLDGPWRDRTGFAMTIEQASGLAWVTGYDDLPLVVRGACDPIGGMHTVFALLLALELRRGDAEGRLVEVPMIEPALNVAAEQVIEYSAYGALLSRAGNRGPVSAPQGVYVCAKGEPLALAVATDAQWRALRALLGDPAWARDPALDAAAGRRAAHDAIDAGIAAWLASRDRDSAVDELIAVGVPAHAVVNGRRLMPNPQLEHRRFYQTLEHPVTGKTRYPGLPMHFSRLGAQLHRRPPPLLGQHNEEVLCGELGATREELARLAEAKVIGERPTFM